MNSEISSKRMAETGTVSSHLFTTRYCVLFQQLGFLSSLFHVVDSFGICPKPEQTPSLTSPLGNLLAVASAFKGIQISLQCTLPLPVVTSDGAHDSKSSTQVHSKSKNPTKYDCECSQTSASDKAAVVCSAAEH